jgi:hypothetical protein
MTQDAWLDKHPYLQPVADFHAQISAAVAGISIAGAHIPSFDNYIGDYKAGTPLLQSAQAEIDFEPAEVILVSLIESISAKPLPEKLALEFRALNCAAN